MIDDDQPIPGINLMNRNPFTPVFQIFRQDDLPYMDSPLFWGTPKRTKPWKRKPSGKDRTKIKAARKQKRSHK